MPSWMNRVINGVERVSPVRVRGAMSKLSTILAMGAVPAFERLVADSKSRSAALAGYAKRESLYSAAVHSSNLAFLTSDTNGIITGWNPGAERLFGYSADEAIGRDIEMLVPADRRGEMVKVWENFWIGERIDNFATVRMGKGGKPIHVVVDISPLRTPTNELVGSSAIVRDATEQRVAEDLFGLAVEACPSGMIMIDRTGRIVMANAEIENLFGYRREELLSRPIEMLVPEELRSKHAKFRADFAKRPPSRSMGKRRELFGLRKDGSEFPVEIELNSAHIRDGLLILAVVVDVSERKRTERLKDEFISTVSHELRTPLTSVTASLALLSAGGAGPLPEPASRLVSIAHSNGQRLVRLINDILDIEKIDSGKMTFDFKQMNARAVVEQAIETSRAYADEFGVKMRLDSDSVPGEIRADTDRLAQVITNLLSNAIKFSPRGEDVVVAVAEREDTVRITVRDHGPGIPDEFKPRIFEKFAQADASDARQKGGTGLGLSIVKQIVDRLGGEVGFESALGYGTLFFVEMPRWRSSVDDGTGVAERGNQIMLCEDDPDVAAALTAKLAKVGFNVDVASTVTNALHQADSTTYAAVLVDLKLPNGDGIGLIQKLRSRQRYHDKPIVAISGDPKHGRDDLRLPALDVLDWLDKPVDLARLLRVLDRSIVKNGNSHPRILHVDEDPAVRATVAEAMRRSAQVVSVASLEEAHSAIANKPFEFAVLDVALIASSDPELLADLLNADGHLIPVVLLSAQGANLAYADRVRGALAKASNSIDDLIGVLTLRLGTTASQNPSGHEEVVEQTVNQNNDKEVA